MVAMAGRSAGGCARRSEDPGSLVPLTPPLRVPRGDSVRAAGARRAKADLPGGERGRPANHAAAPMKLRVDLEKLSPPAR